jgi:hypothetical protein
LQNKLLATSLVELKRDLSKQRKGQPLRLHKLVLGDDARTSFVEHLYQDFKIVTQNKNKQDFLFTPQGKPTPLNRVT